MVVVVAEEVSDVGAVAVVSVVEEEAAGAEVVTDKVSVGEEDVEVSDAAEEVVVVVEVAVAVVEEEAASKVVKP